jgi:MFS family permease
MSERSDSLPDASARRLGVYGAVATLLGIVLSGPLALLVVNQVHPQPPWDRPALLASHYHPIQTLPFLAGFILVGGLVLLVVSLHSMARAELRPFTRCGVVLTAVFASFILLNYTIQTTFVPHLLEHYSDENAALLTAFSMVNPTSLAWGLEMWGYGFLGVATWLVAPVLGESRLGRAASRLFVANGVVSVVSAVWTAVQPGWVMTIGGYVGFAAWNILLFAMAALALAALRNGARSTVRHPEHPSSVPGPVACEPAASR